MTGWLLFGLGFFLGMLLLGGLLFLLMPKMMIQVHPSRFASVEATCQALTQAIEEKGWTVAGIRDMNAAVERGGSRLDRTLRVVELCNAHHAAKVIADHPEISTMMPCAWGVYPDKQGRIWISGMNMKLMATLFGGTIARVMGKDVAKEEAAILKRVVAS